MEKILIIDDDESLRIILSRLVEEFGCEILNAANGAEGIRIIGEEHPDLIISDLVMPHVGGMDVLTRAKEIDEQVPVIIVTAFDEMSTTIEAIQRGAFDYVAKPIHHDRFKLLVRRALEGRRLKTERPAFSPEEAAASQGEHVLIGNTPGVKEIFKKIGMVSGNRVTVLITGESGTGKELVARIIHYSGITRDQPFVAINCSALTETLLQSELFGHVKGAFTGAIRDKKGKFELAGEGTILLDEISEMSPDLQVKLLRVIQEKQFERVGGEESIPVRARIITSTNKDMVKLVEEGKFREDLYFRLKVFTIELPPLRDRKEDIPQLVVYLLAKINAELHKNVNVVPYEVMEMLQSYGWVGNVRELENVLTQGVLLARGNVLERSCIVLGRNGSDRNNASGGKDLTLAEVEIGYIRSVLRKVNWNKNEAVRILGISKSTLYDKIQEYGIVKDE
ncbi:MAG: sigma-54 dependent transcriptional regulator [Bacteroidetes bacterium]|nr:sigma-54 dependent transcriptional regulator [Bacteroidota bacterium]